jgi:hypothetical protein
MIKPVAFVFCLQVLLLVAALATPGDDLLVAKLPKDLRSAAKVPERPLVQATKDAVKGSRSLAPQITAAAVRRATDCASAEAVLRAVQLAPTPTAMELFAITRAAIGAAPHEEGTTVNSSGEKVASTSCTEALLAAAASEYPDLASVLNDSGKQVAQKQVAGSEEAMGNSPSGQGIGNSPSGRGVGNSSAQGTGNSPSSEQGTGYEPGGLGAPLIPPAVTFPPNGGGLVSETTPITAGQ